MLISQEEYIKRVFKNESIDFKNPLCNNCNECCTITAMITPDEYKKLNKFLKTKGKSIYKDAVSRHIKLAKKYNCRNFKCPFSTLNKKCAIYSMRPAVCRNYHCTPSLNKLEPYDEFEEHLTINDLFKGENLTGLHGRND